MPNVVTYPGVVLALAAAAFMPHGDLKLAALIGAALGIPAAYSALALGVIAGGMAMAFLLITGSVSRRQVTPYAPCLAISAIAVVFVQGTAFAPL